MENSKIEWCDHTVNLWWGCTEVHAGCDHCYAKTLAARWGFPEIWNPTGPRRAVDSAWHLLEQLQKKSAAKGGNHIDVVFINSMADIFEKPMPFMNAQKVMSEDANDGSPFETDMLRDRLFNEVIPLSRNLFFLLLTKRAVNIRKMVPTMWLRYPAKNVMYGYSAVDKDSCTQIQYLTQTPGRHFLSCEPLLEEIDISRFLDWIECNECSGSGSLPVEGGGVMCGKCMGVGKVRNIDWVIAGGESGRGARPTHPDWVRSLRDQCDKYDVPFFFKQWGEWMPYDGTVHKLESPHHMITLNRRNKEMVSSNARLVFEETVKEPDVAIMIKKGKKNAGALLDGKKHKNFPVWC